MWGTNEINMYEEAREILNYLPIEPRTETLYINHLWGAFEALIEKKEPVRAFSILPFHLLFMLAIQYKIYRISAWKNSEYLKILMNCRTYRYEDRIILIRNAPIPDKNGLISRESSVRNLSKIKEGHIFRLLKVIDVDDLVIKKARILVDIRGTYAHANGIIEENIESRINEYLSIFQSVQLKMPPLNDQVADKWLADLEQGESMADYLELYLGKEYLCQADFETGKLGQFSKYL